MRRWAVWALSGVVLTGALLGVVLWRERGSPREAPPTSGRGAEAESPSLYEDVTAASGVNFTYRNGQEANHYAILESLGGGVGLLDYDGDGRLDVFLTGGGAFGGPDKKQILGHPWKLYRNEGGWTFRDVTAEAGLDRREGDQPFFYSHGAAVADYDRDGRPDLLATGYGGVALFRNEPGGRFREVTRAAGLARPEPFWATSAAWGDLDGDGWPDLYVCQYVDWSFANHPPCEGYKKEIEKDVCPPKQFEARPHALYRNKGDGAFADVGREAGLHFPRAPADYDRLEHLSPEARKRLREADWDRDFGKGLGVVLVDIDGDGRPEVYVANDTTDKFLYANVSRPGRILLEDRGLSLGAARDETGVANGSMGVDAADYDGGGRPSLLVTNYENELHALYRNVLVNGRVLFKYNSMAAGLAGLGRQYVGFGTGFPDVDNDGWPDIVIANGHVIRHPTGAKVRQRPLLLRNGGGTRFTNVTAQGGPYFLGEHQGRGLAVGDLDNDGRPDLVVSHLNEPVTLLRNRAGPDHNWLGVELADGQRRDLVGAKLTLEVNGRVLTRFATGGGSYLSSGDRRHLFGLGKADKVGRLTVTWPWGRTDTWDGLAPGRYGRLVAGEK